MTREESYDNFLQDVLNYEAGLKAAVDEYYARYVFWSLTSFSPPSVRGFFSLCDLLSVDATEHLRFVILDMRAYSSGPIGLCELEWTKIFCRCWQTRRIPMRV